MDPFDITSVDFEPPDIGSPAAEPEPFPVVLSRDTPLIERPKAPAPPPAPVPVPVVPPPPPPAPAYGEDAAAVTRQIRMSDFLGTPAPQAPPAATPPPPEPVAPSSRGMEPQGRTLADLYFAQGHYAEALRIYDELAVTNPYDEELRRMRRDAEARLLPASSTPGAGAPDAALQRRLGKIRALKQWLSVVQAR
jgi:hypothetical protein